MSFARVAAITVLANTLIAAFLSVLLPGHGFGLNLLYSQCIGLSICALAMPAIKSRRAARTRLALAAAAIPAGTLAGLLIAWSLSGWPDGLDERLGAGTQALAIGLVFGTLMSGLFYLRERAAGAESALHAEQLRLLAAEKSALEMELRLLQAQIEPHFLFNTLANVASRIDTDPGEAREMLEHTIRYLRATLARSRASGGTLGQELDIVEAYLGILQMRLGKRLAWRIDVPPALRQHPCPPLLLQPLVENAVKHGIEPKIEGGSLSLSAALTEGTLSIVVSDTGRGLAESGAAPGMGLASVRERLRALYGGAARLVLEPNPPGGLVARVDLPA